MPPETCGICGAAVALGDAAHVMLNAKSEEGVRDYYVCPTCFEEELLPHFPDPAGETGDDAETGEENADGDNAETTTEGESEPEVQEPTPDSEDPDATWAVTDPEE